MFDNFHRAARDLQGRYSGKIELLVGMEIDWLRRDSRAWVDALLRRYPLDMFVGSVHHVHGVPIDYDHPSYHRLLGLCAGRAAERAAGCSAEEVLFEDYFDAQFDMLVALRSPVVGHFDLIRLLAGAGDGSLERWSGVWEKIVRNLEFVRSYGGCLELNSAGLRKGLKEPYPRLEVCRYFDGLGGRFVFSDDSHGIGHVGHSYDGLLKHAELAGIKELAVFSRGFSTSDTLDERFPGVGINMVSIESIEGLEFWKRRS